MSKYTRRGRRILALGEIADMVHDGRLTRAEALVQARRTVRQAVLTTRPPEISVEQAKRVWSEIVDELERFAPEYWESHMVGLVAACMRHELASRGEPPLGPDEVLASVPLPDGGRLTYVPGRGAKA